MSDYFSLSQFRYILQFSSVASDSLQPYGLQHARLPCPFNSSSLLKFMSTESVMPSNHLILCHPLLLLPSVFPSIRMFSNESSLHIRSPKYWSFSFSISPSNEYSGLISFCGDLIFSVGFKTPPEWGRRRQICFCCPQDYICCCRLMFLDWYVVWKALV